VVPHIVSTPVVVKLSAMSLRDHWRGAAGSTVVSVAWLLLGLRSPTVTYHFAPLIVGIAWPYLLASLPYRLSSRQALTGAVAGVSMAISTGVLLIVADSLNGPTLWGDGPVMVEVVPAALIGAAFGYRSARRGGPAQDAGEG
jgi:hypothetical protein